MTHSTRFSRQYWLRLTAFSVTLFGGAAVSLFIYFFQLQLKYFVTPVRFGISQTPASIQKPYEDLILTTQDGLKIAAWYIPGQKSQAIIVVHGINANREAVLPEAAVLAEAGYPLLLIDLRGHGQSEGNEVTYGYREAYDILAAVDYLDQRPEIEQLGVMGGSLGGAAVARAAGMDPRLVAVVIESSYSSLPAAIEDAFEVRSVFPKWPFAPLFITLAERRLDLKAEQVNSAAELAKLGQRSVLIIHGDQDDQFPLHHAETMYAAASGPKSLWIVEGMGHQSPVLGQEEAFKAHVLPFFEAAFAAQLLEGAVSN
jgi:dipeptidyl aminopeptidase/acylaminoacyl peptidase